MRCINLRLSDLLTYLLTYLPLVNDEDEAISNIFIWNASSSLYGIISWQI